MTSAPLLERRADPRLPLDAPVVLLTRHGRHRGRSLDASVGGLLVELSEPLSPLDRRVGVRVRLPLGDVITLEADVIRRSRAPDGAVLVAVRFRPAAGGRALLRRAGTRAAREAARGLRPVAAARLGPDLDRIRAELRALGSHAVELACEVPEEAPPPAMVEWLAVIAASLERPAPAATTNRSLVHVIADLHRRVPAAREGGRDGG